MGFRGSEEASRARIEALEAEARPRLMSKAATERTRWLEAIARALTRE